MNDPILALGGPVVVALAAVLLVVLPLALFFWTRGGRE